MKIKVIVNNRWKDVKYNVYIVGAMNKKVNYFL
jgi:hypothetical protein